jgi:hypothetical protein
MFRIDIELVTPYAKTPLTIRSPTPAVIAFIDPPVMDCQSGLRIADPQSQGGAPLTQQVDHRTV